MTDSKKAPAKKAKSKSRKTKSGGGGNMHKSVDSQRIAEDIAAFEKSGGQVEKLGVTRVLQKIGPEADREAAAKAAEAAEAANEKPAKLEKPAKKR